MIPLKFDLTSLPDHEGTFLWDSPVVGLKLITVLYSVPPVDSEIVFDPYLGVPELGWMRHNRLTGNFVEIKIGE